jgi:4-amino-4-deoxy-L-arabinose transferase-like glycosyltransferase
MSFITRQKSLLFLILLTGAFFRFYNLNWDQGHHFHPDERAITITAEKIRTPENLSEFLSPASPLNPQFFAYGSFPIYLLKGAGSILSPLNHNFGTYTSLNLLGRFLSGLADILTVFVIFKIGKKIFNNTVGIIASAFYALSVLPVQLSHFFAVDTFLTLFITLALYALILYCKKPSGKNALSAGAFFGLALATKISAIVLLVPIGAIFLIDIIPLIKNLLGKTAHHAKLLSKSVKQLLIHNILIFVSAFATFAFFMPYALIDFQNFWQQTVTQSELTRDPFYFPYTLQFVGKIPYWYEFKNIFFWGLGPFLGTLAFAGAAYFTYLFFKKNGSSHFHQKLILLTFFLAYTLTVGNFAVGFMRYMLPIYPLFALFAALLADKLNQTFSAKIKNKFILNTLYLILYTLLLIWPLSFMQTYNRPNTRIQASNWIYRNIPQDKILAIEHWDDQLPVGKPITYPTQVLKLYDPDTEYKWQEIEVQLAVSDYIIIASNRLYTPLQKLTDCARLPEHKCYPRTAEYYKKLFSGELGFRKVAEFTSFPTIPILNITIDDQSADENFTVFDHPKVMIFQKIRNPVL